MRFFIHCLGCKINQYEAQSLRESWTGAGHIEADTASQADVVLVHTCAVTAGAVADSRGAVRRAGREAPGASILVAGCAAQTEPAAFRGLPGVALVATGGDKPGLAAWPGRPAAQEEGGWPAFAISRFQRARPILKVQDGCSHCCTYCIVPRARGGPRSRPFEDILAEARRLLGSGHRELILSGINLGQFRLEPAGPGRAGRDSPGPGAGNGERPRSGGFWDMLARLEAALAPEWAGRARLRLSSLDPGMLGEDALEVLAASRMTCPHLHVSMQSADPGVLAAMGRSHYGPEGVLGFLGRLRSVWPVAAVGADLLTGFPGESEEAFARTLAFCREAGLTYAHVFPFSTRPGTVAARMGGHLPASAKKERAARLRLEAAGLEAAFAERLAGLAELEIVVERQDPGVGATQYYVEARLEGPSPVAAGRLLRVRPAGVEGAAVLARPVGREPVSG